MKIQMDLALVADENLKRVLESLQATLNAVPLFSDFKFMEITDVAAVVNKGKLHNLNFTPKDVILLSVTPSTTTVTFKPELFTDKEIVYTATGACKIRCFIGSYSEVQ